MKSIATALFLALGLATGLGVNIASADSLTSMKSACLAGDFNACSRYNAAIISRNTARGPVLTQGYDPFRIVPATKADRTTVRPAGAPGDKIVGNSGLTNLNVVKVQ